MELSGSVVLRLLLLLRRSERYGEMVFACFYYEVSYGRESKKMA